MKIGENAANLARAVIDAEAIAVSKLANRIDNSFITACNLLLNCQGRIVVTGMGKSGHIGNKIAATLASTGSPAFYVHPAEASHGDLGMITPQDAVIAISYSGETEELIKILPVIKRFGIPLISLTGNPNSTLANFADVNLDVSIEQEACPLGLAPTSSTTVALVMGDALAIALLDAQGFTEKDFALSHPGGSLGRKLLLQVDAIMHANNEIPIVQSGSSLKAAIVEISKKSLGMAAVVDYNQKLVGICTDGDLRRAIERDVNFNNATIDEVMTTSFTTIKTGTLAQQALQIMQSRKINGLLVVNDAGNLVGAFNMQDLLKAKVV